MFRDELLEKYIQLIKTEDFVKYKKTFANNLYGSLNKEYRQKSTEPTMVQKIEEIINNLNKSILSKGVNISTKGIFIHGR
jgi:hypothetical protein